MKRLRVLIPDSDHAELLRFRKLTRLSVAKQIRRAVSAYVKELQHAESVYAVTPRTTRQPDSAQSPASACADTETHTVAS